MRYSAADFGSLAVQFLAIFGPTLLFTYFIVLTCRRWTYVASHLRVFVNILVASAVAFAYYRVCVALRINLWIAFVILLVVWAWPLNLVLSKIDGGRGLIDTDPERKVLFRTDYRVIRIAAQLSVMTLVFYWSKSIIKV